jgi:hypothetical protein
MRTHLSLAVRQKEQEGSEVLIEHLDRGLRGPMRATK